VREIPVCNCGRPIRFSNQTQCEDCWNEPQVIGRKADGSPYVTGVLASPRTFQASVFPSSNQFMRRAFAQRIKLREMLRER
jgi:hypothetical protein